jgi:hypothetical protein
MLSSSTLTFTAHRFQVLVLFSAAGQACHLGTSVGMAAFNSQNPARSCSVLLSDFLCLGASPVFSPPSGARLSLRLHLLRFPRGDLPPVPVFPLCRFDLPFSCVRCAGWFLLAGVDFSCRRTCGPGSSLLSIFLVFLILVCCVAVIRTLSHFPSQDFVTARRSHIS